MRKKISFLLGLLLTCLFSHSQKSLKLEINGNLKWLNENEKIILQVLSGSYGTYSKPIVDSVRAKNGRFHLSTHVENGPRLFFLKFTEHNTFSHLFVDNENVTIEDKNIGKIPKEGYITDYLKTSGSNSNEAWVSAITLAHITAYYDGDLQSYIRKIEDSIGFDSKPIESLIRLREMFFDNILYELKDKALKSPGWSAVVPDLIKDGYKRFGKNPLLNDIYNSLDIKSKESYAGKILQKSLASTIGKPAADFVVRSSDGNQSTLKEVSKRGKLTLLYFWSLEPTRPRANMILELLGLYRKYQDKGLNVVSVYVGKDSSAFIRSIMNDNLPWYQAADFKGALDGIAGNYGFTWEVEPFTILLDSQGRIYNWLTQGAVLKYYIEQKLD